LDIQQIQCFTLKTFFGFFASPDIQFRTVTCRFGPGRARVGRFLPVVIILKLFSVTNSAKLLDGVLQLAIAGLLVRKAYAAPAPRLVTFVN
jgi:hypothetical protein